MSNNNSDQISTNTKIKMVNTAFRTYAHTDDQFEHLSGGQGQVALVFAKDTDGHGNFKPNFSVTPDEILDFKSSYNFKFFLSMGGYPFNLNPDDVPAAVETLTNIIRSYHFDGIDVYYENIPVRTERFVKVMRDVIMNLEDKITNLEVSLTVPPGLNDKYYSHLYEKVSDRIDYVIYQTYSMPDPVNTVGRLVQKFKGLQYPAVKLFAGHSVLSTDWNNVPLLVFLGALPVLLNQGLISGISEWAASGV